MKITSDNITVDDFLGGKISLHQPRHGYRANIDSVLLASAVNATAGTHVLELGCGVGAVIYCLKARVPDATVTGVEVQKIYAELAIVNAEKNNFEATIVHSCISAIPNQYKKSKFHFVILNPPYRKNSASFPSKNIGRDISTRESDLKLDDWINIAVTRCSINGQVVLIHEAERLYEILKAFGATMGDICILPLLSYKNLKAKRVLIRATKGRKGGISILSPLIIHKVDRQHTGGENYTKKTKKILSEGAALNW